MSWIDPPPMRATPADGPAGSDAGPHGVGPADGGPGGVSVRALALRALVVGLVAFALGLVHLLPGVAFWDTGEMQTVAPVFGTAHPTGYPAYVVVGWLASVVLQWAGSPALVMNLLSAILIGAAAAVSTLLFGRLSSRPVLAVAGGLVVAVMPETRYLATHADAHALQALLIGAIVLLLVVWGDRSRAGRPRTDRWLVVASLLYGVALANQASTILFAPGIGLYVLAVEPRIVLRPRMVVGCAVAVLGTAALLYLQLPLAVALGRPLIYARPGTVDGFLYVVLGQQFRSSVQASPLADPARTLAWMADAMSGELGLLALAVIPAAVVVAVRRPRYALLTIPGVVITLAFTAVYDNAEIERYYVGPAILVVSWLVFAADRIVGLVARAVRRRRPSAAPRAGTAAAVLLAVALLAFPLARIPATEARVEEVAWLDARSFVDESFDLLAQDATVVSWWSTSTPLWYGTIVEGRRPDIRIVDDRTRLDDDLGTVEDVISAGLRNGPVYVVRPPAEISDLKERFVLERVPIEVFTPIYRVVSERGVLP